MRAKEIFQGRGGFVEQGHFDKLFVKITRKKGGTGRNFGAFLLDILKSTFRMEDSNQVWPQLGPFFKHQCTFFDFQKRAGKATPTHPLPHPPNSCAPGYASICLYLAAHFLVCELTI